MAIEKSLKLEDLLTDGFTKKFAAYYINHAEAEYNNHLYNREYVTWAHGKGFLAESAYAYGLNETNYDQYLSDYDYYKIWPLNNWSRIWVNDKLTLKLMLADKSLEGFMPKYYYYSWEGSLKPLSDAPETSGNVFEDFLSLLQIVGEFACKPNNGTASEGFVRLSYGDGAYFINGNHVTASDICQFVKRNTNYLFTEYIRPSNQFEKYAPTIHTLRIVVMNEDGFTPRIAGGYLRLPNKNSGEANYKQLDGSNAEEFNVFCEVDFLSGWFGNAKLTYSDRVMNTLTHPDTGEIIEGTIPDFEQLKKKILYIAKKFSTLEWMGFDIGITESGFKCMEINTHPGIKYMQIYRSLYAEDELKDYFIRRLSEVDELDESEKAYRNRLIR